MSRIFYSQQPWGQFITFVKPFSLTSRKGKWHCWLCSSVYTSIYGKVPFPSTITSKAIAYKLKVEETVGFFLRRCQHIHFQSSYFSPFFKKKWLGSILVKAFSWPTLLFITSTGLIVSVSQGFQGVSTEVFIFLPISLRTGDPNKSSWIALQYSHNAIYSSFETYRTFLSQVHCTELFKNQFSFSHCNLETCPNNTLK